MNDPEIAVKKWATRTIISTEMALHLGLITEEQARAGGWTPPEPVHVSWLRRMRWALSSWWYEHWPRVHFGPCNHEDCG